MLEEISVNSCCEGIQRRLQQSYLETHDLHRGWLLSASQ
jgi:hypothetical protein